MLLVNSRSSCWALLLIVSACARAAPTENERASPPAVPAVRPSPGAGTSAPGAAPSLIRGVNWVAGGEITTESFDPLVNVHGGWIAQTPFGWQERIDSPAIRLATSGRVYWGERDLGIEETTRLASARGIRTMLKPHLWIRRGAWPGDIQMTTSEEWDAWFEGYRIFILHYARLAERIDADAFCIGTELRHAAVDHPDRWRSLIAEIRGIYRGRLTYGANWYGEYDKITFWDALDFIGVQAYFPLSDHRRPSTEELRAAWKPHLAAIRQVSERFDKPVVFTEIGYRSSADAAIEPWRWDERGGNAELDLDTQQRCYEALFQTLSDEPWFEGVFLWKWFPEHWSAGGSDHAGFTPQNKPAERVIARWFEQWRGVR